MRALECERPCVLLIDELDKVEVAKEVSSQFSFDEDPRSLPYIVADKDDGADDFPHFAQCAQGEITRAEVPY
jgi:hypothetical protein